jgi:hypothetical protein
MFEVNVDELVRQAQERRYTRRRSLGEVARMQWDAWLTERATDVEVRVLHCQQQLVAERSALAQAELAAARSFVQEARQLEEEQYEWEFERTVRALPPYQARVIIDQDIETQRLLQERDLIRRGGNPPRRVVAAPAPRMQLPEPAPAVEPHITEREIARLALRAATRFSQLEPQAADKAWARWEQEVRYRFPSYAAEEIIERANEMSGW